jgi:hypothetical protein
MNITPAVFTDAATFAETWLKILNKKDELVPLCINAAQRHYLDNRTPRDLVLKARQLGFSTLIQAELYRQAVTGTARTATLSHKDDSTQALRRMANRFYENMPENLRPARKYANASLATYPDFNSEAVIATAGGKGPGRSLTTSFQHWSEVAYWTNAAEIIAGIMQAGSPKWIVAESTANGAQGWFYERCMEALDGNTDWALHFYPWWWDADYRLPLKPGQALVYTDEEARLVERHNLTSEQINWRRVKWRELRGVGGSANLFPQEYPEDPQTCFLQSGNSYFGDLSARYGAPFNPDYDPDARYGAGLDFGQTEDYTVCTVVDLTHQRQVEKLRVNRQEWAEMRRRVRELCIKWNVAVIVPEENSMGKTNIEALVSEFREHGVDTRIEPFHTTNASKATAAADWHKALHEDGWQMQDTPERKAEYRAFAASQTQNGTWTLGAASGAHDDIVIADILAYHARLYATKVWIL